MREKTFVDGRTRIACLIGNPTRHSLSPLIHNTAYEALGLNYIYLALEVRDIKKTFEGLKQMNVAGFNVTMPFKQGIMQHLDRIDEQARKVQAVNTVVNRNGIFVGYNTDGTGAVNALKKVTGISGKRVLLFGAGGAGRAIAFALHKEKAKLTIVEKAPSKVKALAKSVGADYSSIADIGKLLPDITDIIINATPVGMRPDADKSIVPAELLKKGMVVFDIVYDPVKTKLLKDARRAGCTTLSGVEMLLEQAFEGFELFTGRKAPKGKIRKAVYRELMQ